MNPVAAGASDPDLVVELPSTVGGVVNANARDDLALLQRTLGFVRAVDDTPACSAGVDGAGSVCATLGAAIHETARRSSAR